MEIGAIAVAGAFGSSPAGAQSMAVNGSPGLLRITTAVAGSAPTTVTEATTQYSTNTLLIMNKSRITAVLNSPMPAGVTLTITLAAQTFATNLGEITLSTTAQSVVTDIPALSTASNLAITYRMSATSAAGVVGSSSRTVTLTILTQ